MVLGQPVDIVVIQLPSPSTSPLWQSAHASCPNPAWFSDISLRKRKRWKFRDVQLELISRKSFGFFWPFSWLGKNKRLVFNGMESSQIIVPGFVIHNFLVWIFRVKATSTLNKKIQKNATNQLAMYLVFMMLFN